MARPRRHQQGSDDSDEDGDWVAFPATSSGAPAAERRCKVDGCGVSLAQEKTFFRRSRCCQMHARELLVHLDGQARRLCQQCSSFHPISAFDGTKRSCRERLELHKIRQRELNSRRMAQAMAYQAAQEAAEAGPTVATSDVHVPTLTASMLPAAPPGYQLSTVQAATLLAAQQLQQQCMAQTQHPQMPVVPLQPTMPLIPTQQQQAPQQQQGLGGFDSAATATDAPGIFSDVPLNELPFYMQPQCQVEKTMNWETQKLSTFWDAPPPASCGSGDRIFKAQSVPLARPPSKDGLCINATSAAASFRSLSASAGSESDDWLLWWAGATGSALPPSLGRSSEIATKFAGNTDIRRLVGSCGFGQHQASVVLDTEDQAKWHRWSPFDTAPRVSAKRPAEDASLPPQQSVKRASVESAGPRRSSQVLFEGCSLKAAFRGGGGMLGRGFDGMQTTTGLRTAECCDGHNLAAASWHVSLDRHNSRGSDASSPSRFTPPASADEEPLPFAERRSASLPLSVRTPLFTKLPFIDEEAHSRAFQEQAPEPLYLAAQLVTGMGLCSAELPEFSYGRSSGSDASGMHDFEGDFVRKSAPGRLQ